MNRQRIVTTAFMPIALLVILAATPSAADTYDVAAFYWPSLHYDERWATFFPDGSQGEWESIRNCKPKWEGHYQPRVPAWGYLMDNDPKAMEKKIDAATSHGVNVMIFDWYWFENKPFLESALNDGFLKAKNVDKMKFYLMWANHDAKTTWDIRRSHKRETIWPGSVDLPTFKTVAARVIKQYFSHASYYKIDGKPVFSIYDMNNLIKGLGGVQQTVEALDYFRAQVREAGFPGLHLQMIYWGKVPKIDDSGFASEKGTAANTIKTFKIDSLTNYQFAHLARGMGDYIAWADKATSNWSKWSKQFDVPYFPHVSIGWDNNARFVEKRGAITENANPETFKKYLARAKAYADAHPDQPKLITINAWNEWVEGSYLEPDERFGMGYLEAVRDVFGSRKKGQHAKAKDRVAGRPNVLFIAIDDLRPELGCYGADHIKSPNIDKLASQGIVFNRAYCQYPQCGVSRASLFSGMRPTAERFNTRNESRVDKDTPDILSLPGVFKEAGYHTVSNGKLFHHLDDTAEQSWSEPPFWLIHGDENNNHLTFHDKESANFILKKNKRGPFFEAPDVPDSTYIDGQICEKTIKDMHRLQKMDKPFFLACGFVRPHLPFYAPKKYWDMYKPEEIELAENRFKPKNAPSSLRGSREIFSYHHRDIEYNSKEFHKTARHGYYACVSYADALVGKLLAALDELALRDDTIVVIWGDHGWHVGEHNFWGKINLLHNATRSPLIIRAPGFSKDVKTDGIVELVDIYPTLCELAGIERPTHLEGASMVPLMRDPRRPWKKAAFIRCRHDSSVVTRDYAYTEFENGERMLFDRRKDPDENVNVAEQAEYQETVKELSKLLAEGWEKAHKQR